MKKKNEQNVSKYRPDQFQATFFANNIGLLFLFHEISQNILKGRICEYST